MNTFAPGGPTRVRFFTAAALLTFSLLLLSLDASGQVVPACTAGATSSVVRAEGLAEQIGDLTVSCTGGTANSPASITIFITLNTNITSRRNADGSPQGITVMANSVPQTVQQQLFSATTLFLNNIAYTIPATPSTPVNIIVSGIRAAAANISPVSGVPLITATVGGIGASFPSQPPIPVALVGTALLTSTINNGIPCAGSPSPSSLDFAGFTSAQSVYSAVRITENQANSFTGKTTADDTGLRVLVNLSAYSSGARVFVPDAIVGNDGSQPTSAGAFSTAISPGSFAPGNHQLLLLRVNGADATGLGGGLVFNTPMSATDFSSVAEIALTNGAGYAVYEVVDGNNNVKESAQIPLFLVAAPTACTGSIVVPALNTSLAPVSTVGTGTAADPIPRFKAVTPGSDCSQLGDCNANYFPSLSVDTTPINLSGASLGNRQAATFVASNSGGGILGFTASVTYQSGSGSWLTLTPTSAQNFANFQVYADPATLQPGTYAATINVSASAGCVVCSAAVPVTFVVGPPGVTIQNVGNAASFQYGTVAPGSYAVLFGQNLSGTNVGVTFNQIAATIVFSSATQINLIVPASLGAQVAADVLVTVDGKISNSFRVTLALNSPGIFSNGIVNFDGGGGNTSADPVARGSFAIVYLTGLSIPVTGQVTVNIGSETNLIPAYAGAQGTLPALDQFNVVVPATLPASPNPIPLTVCIPGPTGQQVCSNAVNLYIK
jgi:uncharacterized protein (TIGR03437 family)